MFAGSMPRRTGNAHGVRALRPGPHARAAEPAPAARQRSDAAGHALPGPVVPLVRLGWHSQPHGGHPAPAGLASPHLASGGQRCRHESALHVSDGFHLGAGRPISRVPADELRRRARVRPLPAGAACADRHAHSRRAGHPRAPDARAAAEAAGADRERTGSEVSRVDPQRHRAVRRRWRYELRSAVRRRRSVLRLRVHPMSARVEVRHVLAAALFPAALWAQGDSASKAAGPPVRRIATASAVSTEQIGSITSVRELPNGRLLLNDGARRRLLLMDTTLKTIEVVLDSLTEVENSYGTRPAVILPYRADSTLFIDQASLAMLVIDPAGTV